MSRKTIQHHHLYCYEEQTNEKLQLLYIETQTLTFIHTQASGVSLYSHALWCGLSLALNIFLPLLILAH